MIPIYRAKKYSNNEWIEGLLILDTIETGTLDNTEMNGYFIQIINPYKGYKTNIRIDKDTISIHFPNMIDIHGKKIFASLNSNGFGGDIVTGMCRDCNGDELQGLHAPVPFEGIVKFYNETVMGVVIETSDRIAIGTESWAKPILLERGSPLRWSDCRHQIEVKDILKEENNVKHP